jgi:hypothetical protein
MGLRTPKQGYETAEDLVRCLDLLDICEKQFGLPFVRDPRVIEGQHLSELIRGNSRGLVP